MEPIRLTPVQIAQYTEDILWICLGLMLLTFWPDGFNILIASGILVLIYIGKMLGKKLVDWGIQTFPRPAVQYGLPSFFSFKSARAEVYIYSVIVVLLLVFVCS